MPNFAFHALDRNPANGVMDGVRRGIGALTEGRTGVIYQPDWEDIWRPFRSGEPAYKGGRRVENLALQSNDFDTTWIAIRVVAPTKPGTISDPDGGLNGWLLSSDGASTGAARLSQVVTSITVDDKVTTYVRAKLNPAKSNNFIWLSTTHVGTGPDAWFNLSTGAVGTVDATATATIVDEGDGWYRCTITYDVADAITVGGAYIGLATVDGVIGITNDGTEGVYIYGAQLENVSGQADTSPSEYQPTTTAPVATVYATEKDGTPLADLPWLYGGPAGTNVITWSRDLTNAAWTGLATAVLDAVGLRGEANGATTLTDDDGGTKEAIDDTITIPDDSNNHVMRVFVDKDADETRFPELQLFLTGGTPQFAFVQINTLSGATTVRSSTGTIDHEINDVGNRWELLISVTNNTTGNTGALVKLFPALGNTLGGNDNSATGSIVVGNVELHLNKTIAQVRGSTPIFTSGSTVTVDATDLSFDDGNHADLEGAYFCEFLNVGLNAAQQGGFVGMGSNGRIFFADGASAIDAYDGTVRAEGPVITLGADDTEYKLGLAYGSSTHYSNTDGTWGPFERSYDGVYDNTESKLNILHGDNTVAVPNAVMLLRNLRRYDMTYAAAQIAIDGMMNGIYPILANTLTDLRYLALRVLVPTAPPTTNDMLFAWLATEGGTGNTLSDRWRSMLIGKGATPGHFNDMWMEVLALNGFNQPQLNDRQIAFWANGGGLI